MTGPAWIPVTRLSTLDLFKSLLVIGMVLLHVFQILGRAAGLLNHLSEAVDLITRSGFPMRHTALMPRACERCTWASLSSRTRSKSAVNTQLAGSPPKSAAVSGACSAQALVEGSSRDYQPPGLYAFEDEPQLHQAVRAIPETREVRNSTI